MAHVTVQILFPDTPLSAFCTPLSQAWAARVLLRKNRHSIWPYSPTVRIEPTLPCVSLSFPVCNLEPLRNTGRVFLDGISKTV